MVGWSATPQKPQKPEQINNQPEGETLSIYLSPRCNLFAPHTHTHSEAVPKGAATGTPLCFLALDWLITRGPGLESLSLATWNRMEVCRLIACRLSHEYFIISH